jgi:2-dehydro-3-deoxyphosphogluconate aldolase/(4S)-4-hydroxy-2-oxoglutarate aldolase
MAGVVELAHALAGTGLDIFEVTMTTPGALDCVAAIRAKHPEILVGAGTVLDVTSARGAIKAGAQFVVSPTVDPGVVELAKQSGVLAVPGALTPTEAYAAWRLGAGAVKIFPASVGGPSYIRALLGPMPALQLIPTGGVTAENATAYLQAGAFAVCLGTSFLDGEAMARGEYESVVRDAEALVSRVRALAPVSGTAATAQGDEEHAR